jgi:hypothetical protein
LLQNLSSISAGLSQLLQNFEYDSFLASALWVMGRLDSVRRVAIFQTNTISIIIPPATTAKRSQLTSAPVFAVEGNPGSCARVLGGVKLSTDN